MKYGKKRPGAPSSEPREGKTKHGRKEMRNVSRTTRRGQMSEATPEVNQDSDAEVDAGVPADTIDKSSIGPGAAYDALLVLLNSEQKDINSTDQKRKKQKPAPIQPEEDDTKFQLAGVNMSKSDSEGEEDEEEDSAGDEVAVLGDPFETHFNLVGEDELSRQEASIKDKSLRWPIVSKQAFDHAGYISILQMPPGAEPQLSPLVANMSQSSIADHLYIKQRVRDIYAQSHPIVTADENMLLEPMSKYMDINFPYKSHTNTTYRQLYVLHILNHINKTRDRILKNSTKIRTHREQKKEGNLAEDAEEPELRDQGFTRPKVLILLPTRELCNEIVDILINLSGSEQQENKAKFKKQFHDNSEPPEYKPDDFKEAFRGNNSDFFCIGVKFTRKTVKLYSSFYTLDIILASPIGLSMILENPDKKKRQYDFLLSIEILVVDRAHQIEMQNWDHVLTVMKYVNKIPKEFHDADFSRIRMWAINDQLPLLRQLMVFAEYASAQTNNLTATKSSNIAGKLKFKAQTNIDTCMMNSIGLKLKQIYHRFESSSPATDPDARFKFFTNTILPSILKTTSYEDGLLIYVPSYYDYLRIKNHMIEHTKLTFAAIDEYSSQSLLTKTRTLFLAGKVKVLLYTERLHYFRRFEIGGVKNVLMYGPTTNPIFYKEMARFIGKSIFKNEADADLSFMKVMFSKWDLLALGRIVGDDRTSVLCTSTNEMFEFR